MNIQTPQPLDLTANAAIGLDEVAFAKISWTIDNQIPFLPEFKLILSRVPEKIRQQHAYGMCSTLDVLVFWLANRSGQ